MNKLLILLSPLLFIFFSMNVKAETAEGLFFLNENCKNTLSDSAYEPNEPDGDYWKNLNDQQKIILTTGIAGGVRALYSEMFSFPDGINLFRDSNFTKRLAVKLGNDPKNAAEEDSSLLLMMLETLIKFSPAEQKPVSSVTESLNEFYSNEENTFIPVSSAFKYCVFVMNSKENIVNALPEERLIGYLGRLRKFYKVIHDESVK